MSIKKKADGQLFSSEINQNNFIKEIDPDKRRFKDRDC
jgi:hypothetical protein